MRVNIIGHGDSPKGCNWGPRIDENVVIRLKDPSWQLEADYGRRVDYMVASTETMFVMLDYKRIPIEYWAQAKKSTWNPTTEASFKSVAKAPLKIPIEVHKKWSPVYLGLCTNDAPNHSVGTAAITYAAEILRPTEILLVGFDNLLDPNRLDYYKANKGKWPSRHDWHAENKMLPLIEKEYGVVIRAFR